jgi:hypothetical protein
METVSMVLVVIGYLGCLIAGIFILVAAFQESALWGLGCMFVPFVSLAFVITHWDDTKRPFLASLGFAVLIFLGAALGASSS